FAWSVLGAIAEVTQKIGITTGLTCPIIRYHPAIIAQAAATIGTMSDGRFTLALGAGERLNEHVVGHGWPSVDDRHVMLREAIDIIRALWSGELISHNGTYYDVESARVYDLPDKEIPIVVGASGQKSGTLAGEMGAGLMAVEPNRELVQEWKSAGGKGPRYGEMALGYAKSKEEGLKLVHKYMRFGALGWSVLAELPGVAAFEEATQFVKPDDLRASVPHGPDVDAYVQAVKKFTDAGFDHVVLLAVGPDQESFIRFYKDKLAPALRSLG
ncbi:MAG: TIGR03557 family F420-dependent LLM class oxidoreductase, partial [Steroidobacteraceae bacterium]